MNKLESKAADIFLKLGFEVKSYKKTSLIDKPNTVYSQFPFESFKIDFVILKPKLAIEVDGGFWHSGLRNRLRTYQIVQKDRDIRKNNLLTKLGWKLIRINECSVNVDYFSNIIDNLLF